MSRAISTLWAITIIVIIIIAIGAGIWWWYASQQGGKQGGGQKVKIVFASTQLNPPEEQAFIKSLLQDFTKETGIEVDFVAISYDQLTTRLQSEEQSGKVTIDLIGDLHGGLDYFASKGWLTDLSNFPSKYGALSGRTFPKVLEDYSKLHGIKAYIPWMTATYVMVVNHKAYQYLPSGLTPDDVKKGTSKWTYDAFLKWAENLKNQTGSPKVGFPDGPHGLFVRFLHGFLYPDFTGYQAKAFNSTDAVKMWQYLKELWKYVVPQSTTYDEMADPLLKEEVWVAWDHTARIKNAIEQKPDQFDVVPVPAGPKGRGFILVIAGLAIPKNAPHPDAAWKLIEFLTRPEIQVKVLQNTGFFPTVKEATGKIPSGPLKVLAQGVAAQQSASDAVVALIPSLGAKGGDFKNIYITAFNKIVLNNEDIKKTLDQLYPQLIDLFKSQGLEVP